MSQKLIIAPNEFLLSNVDLGTEKVEQGALALNIDWSGELGYSEINDALLKNVVRAESPHISISISQQSNEDAEGISAILMSPQDYIVASFANALPKQAEVTEALKNWTDYFKAVQQHQYLLNECFTIQLLHTSSLPKEQQELSNAVRCALQSDIEASELLQQFEAFSASDKTQSWLDAVCYGLTQYKKVESTNNECTKANEALKSIKSEKEAVQKQLDQKAEKVAELTLQLKKARKEKEAAVKEATITKNTATDLEAKYKGVLSKFASAKEQATVLAAENSELKSENELFLSQTQQLQEELENVFTEADKKKATVASLENKYKETTNWLTEANIEKQRILKENSELKNESKLLLVQTQQLQEELESVFAEASNSKTTIVSLDTKYKETNSKLTEVIAEKERLAKENAEQASENELLLFQIQQLQKELESVFAETDSIKNMVAELNSKYKDAANKLAEVSVEKQKLAKATTEQLNENKSLLLQIQQLQENVKAEEIADLEQEKELLLLQINQLEQELESTFEQIEESEKIKDALIRELDTKLAQAETQRPELQRELKNAMSEQELLQLQIKQLQEELEFYFTEYQKLKGESPDNRALAEFKGKIEERFPQLVLSEGVTLTGGVNQKDLQRITARFTQVEHGGKHWNAFSIIINDRKGVLDIELHAPDKKRVYPLSKFVKTGSNKVCDFSLLSPFTDAGKKALTDLPAEDHLLLIGIVEELQAKLNQNDVQRTEATANLDVSEWPEKLLKLTTALKQLAPAEAPQPLNFKKLRLKQNMVGTTNEHLLICIENLQANGTRYPAFDLKVGAKQIKDKSFTEYGSLEFRELANSQAPLATWPPATKDKWGLKLVLNLPPQLNEEQKNAIESLQEKDKLFIKELLTKLADKLHTLDRKKLKVNQPLENWQKLITGMVAKF